MSEHSFLLTHNNTTHQLLCVSGLTGRSGSTQFYRTVASTLSAYGLLCRKHKATVLYNCVVPDGGPVIPKTRRSWCGVIFIKVCAFIGSNSNN